MSNYYGSSGVDTTHAAIIIVGIILVLGFGVARCATSVSGEDQTTAENEARDFARKLGLKTTGVSCAKTDSDGDGYVSCTLSVEQANGESKVEAIECARALTINDGCRMQKPGVTVRSR